ncbi:hypothetical protein KX816_12485 [Sphingosinicellaceae bacterium]|nr:hypothetical protein KX816_12485 [Sphingosinicellaceae bacterium]
MSDARVWIERLQRAPLPTGVPLPRCPGLTPDERIVVAAIRQMVIDGVTAPGAAEAIALKPESAAVFGALGAWLDLFASRTRWQIAVGAPVHCCPTPDELAMLTVIEGARRGEFALVHRVLGHFVDAADIDGLAHASEMLGERLDAAGFALVARRIGRQA